MADEQLYAIYDNNTKQVISSGTVVGENLPANYVVVAVASAEGVWDKTQLKFIAQSAPEPEPEPEEVSVAGDISNLTNIDIASFVTRKKPFTQIDRDMILKLLLKKIYGI